MSLSAAPHRPSDEHLLFAKKLPGRRDDQVQAMLDLVGLAFEMERFDDAHKMLMSLVLLRPNMPDIYMGFAQVYQRTGALENAALCFEECLELEPHSNLAMVNLAELEHRVRKNPGRAKSLFQRALESAQGSLLTRAQAGLATMS